MEELQLLQCLWHYKSDKKVAFYYSAGGGNKPGSMYIYNSDSLASKTTSNINITIPAGYTKAYVTSFIQHNYVNVGSQSFSSDIITDTNSILNYSFSGANGQGSEIIRNILMTEYTISDEGGTLVYSVSNTNATASAYPVAWKYYIILSN